MLAGVGVDILSTKKICSLWKNHPLRCREVVFTSAELQEVENENITGAGSQRNLSCHQARYLASRFAAKEATVKALGLHNGFSYELTNIEVLGERTLNIRLTGALNRYARQKGIRRLTGSCSSTKQLTIAVVIGEQKDEKETD